MKSSFDLLRSWRGRKIIVDTNILVLRFVGRLNRALIASFKRTQQFDTEDFDLLERVLGKFQKVLTTPNIMTEASNLCGQLPDAERASLFAKLADGITLIEEQYIASADLIQSHECQRFGLTDAAIGRLGEDGHVVLTDDFRLAGFLQKKGLRVINFTHLRLFQS